MSMKRYRVSFKCYVEVFADDEGDALEKALDDLAYATVTDHSEEEVVTE